ncbi:MAG: BLUF domain-containing protein [Pseudomonadota bacterium]
MVFRLIYVSAASEHFDVTTIPSILRISRDNNSRDGVTGLLLFAGGSFLQVLEGAQEAVETTFARIEQDPRHAWIVRLREGEAPARTFPAWSMGWHDCAPGDEVDGLLQNITGRDDVLGLATGAAPEIDGILDAFASRKLGGTPTAIGV